MAMAMILTTDEEAILSKVLRVRRFIGNAKRVGQRCVGQPEQLRSEDQITRENASAPFIYLMRSSPSGDWRRATYWWRPRKDNRDRGDLLTKIFASDHKHCYDTRHDEPGGHREHMGNGDRHGGNFLALVAMQAWFDPVLQDLLQTPARTAKYLNATVQTEKCLSHVSQRHNGQRRKLNNTTRHIINTIRNPRRPNIRNTTLWLFCGRPHTGPTWDIVYGPRSVRRRHCS